MIVAVLFVAVWICIVVLSTEYDIKKKKDACTIQVEAIITGYRDVEGSWAPVFRYVTQDDIKRTYNARTGIPKKYKSVGAVDILYYDPKHPNRCISEYDIKMSKRISNIMVGVGIALEIMMILGMIQGELS